MTKRFLLQVLVDKKLSDAVTVCESITRLSTHDTVIQALGVYASVMRELAANHELLRKNEVGRIEPFMKLIPAKKASEVPATSEPIKYCSDCIFSHNQAPDEKWGADHLQCRNQEVIDRWNELNTILAPPTGKDLVYRKKAPKENYYIHCSMARGNAPPELTCGVEARYYQPKEAQSVENKTDKTTST